MALAGAASGCTWRCCPPCRWSCTCWAARRCWRRSACCWPAGLPPPACAGCGDGVERSGRGQYLCAQSLSPAAKIRPNFVRVVKGSGRPPGTFFLCTECAMIKTKKKRFLENLSIKWEENMKNRAVFIPACLLAAALLAGCAVRAACWRPPAKRRRRHRLSRRRPRSRRPRPAAPDYARAMADAAGPGDIDPAYTDADACLQNAYALAAALFRGDAGAAAAACGVAAEDLAHTTAAAQDDRFPFADLTGLQWRALLLRRRGRGAAVADPLGGGAGRDAAAPGDDRLRGGVRRRLLHGPPAACRRWCRRAAGCPSRGRHTPRSAVSAAG